MMKIEDQVCSLELAKKLKELGVKQESLFWWPTYGKLTAQPDKPCMAMASHEPWTEWTSAFTVAELISILPYEIRYEIVANTLHPIRAGREARLFCLIKEKQDFYSAYYWNCGFSCSAYRAAEACALLLIMLIEKGLMP